MFCYVFEQLKKFNLQLCDKLGHWYYQDVLSLPQSLKAADGTSPPKRPQKQSKHLWKTNGI